MPKTLESKKWTRKIPTVGGWYKHRKRGIERMYYLKPMGFTHPLMPDGILMAQDTEDSNSGKNIICSSNSEFQGCKWLGPLSEVPTIQMFDSVTMS